MNKTEDIYAIIGTITASVLRRIPSSRITWHDLDERDIINCTVDYVCQYQTPLNVNKTFIVSLVKAANTYYLTNDIADEIVEYINRYKPTDNHVS